MNKKAQNQYQPDTVTPPGSILLETIEALEMSQAELAQRMDRPIKTINEIINGKAAITPDTALQLEKVLGISASYWNNHETAYREFIARQKEGQELRSKLHWLKRFPLNAMRRRGWISSSKEPAEQFVEMLRYFGVASPDAWSRTWADVEIAFQTAFRKSQAFDSNMASLAAWLRKGETEASKIKCNAYHYRSFKQALVKARHLTRLDPETFVPKLQSSCAACGVAVVFIPELPGCRASGATRWLTPSRAMIQLSLRYKTDDQLWFSFFHEAAHVVLHGKRDVFLEGNRSLDSREEEANVFAANILIPPAEFERLRARQVFTWLTLKKFADEVGVAPGIVVGRLQHDGLLSWQTNLNRLKMHFIWGETKGDSEAY